MVSKNSRDAIIDTFIFFFFATNFGSYTIRVIS
jgi:hypothetical protein